MSLVGMRFADPYRGVKAEVTEVDEVGGTRLVVLWRIEPGRPRDPFKHVHRTWTEEFEILEGESQYVVGRAHGRATAGQTVRMPPRVPHLHPWNIGGTPLRMRQTALVDPPDIDSIRMIGYGIATLYGLAADGRTRGGMAHPLQLAATLDLFQRYGVFLAGVPAPIQRGATVPVAALARLLGFKPYDPRYLPASETSRIG